MSRAYVIRVSESLVHHRRVSDGVEARLEVLPILGRERTGDLLLEELGSRGWEVDGRKATKQLGNATVTVDAEKGTVSVRGVIEEEVELELTQQGRAYREDDRSSRDRLRKQVRENLEQMASEGDEKVSDELAAELERVLAEIKPELDQATDAVNRSALKERARQLGEVVEVHENADSGEMTIRVKV